MKDPVNVVLENGKDLMVKNEKGNGSIGGSWRNL